MPTSTVAAKQLDIRAENFSSSSSQISLKTYNDSSTYTLYLPETDPKYLDGVSGDLAYGNSVLTYNVSLDKYEWAASSGSSGNSFMVADTTLVADDENGNVLTIDEEVVLQPGDPGYDPAQVKYKVTQKFTDRLLNISSVVSGKGLTETTAFTGAVKYAKTSGMYFDFSDASVNPATTDANALIDAVKQAKDKVTITTKQLFSGGDDASKLVLQPSSAQIQQTFDGVVKSSIEAKKYKTTVQVDDTKNELLNYESALTFKNGGSMYVDNTTKQIKTDMTSIVFGDTGSEHKLCIYNGKMYIQKYDSTEKCWKGADLVLDQITAYTATIDTLTSTPGTGVVDITVAFTGSSTGWDKFVVQIDDQTSTTTSTSAALTLAAIVVPYIGVHKAVVWAVDASGNRVSEKMSVQFTTTA